MLKKMNKGLRVRRFYYSCEVCGRQIDSYEYYTYGKCTGNSQVRARDGKVGKRNRRTGKTA